MATRTRKKNTSDEKDVVVTTVEAADVATDGKNPEVEVVVKPSKPRRVPFDTLVAVVNNCPNELIYVSKHIAGMIVEWVEYGDVQYLELGELNYMRSTDPKFFANNWIIIEESEGYTPEEIYGTIGVDRYYKNVVTPITIDQLLEKSVAEIQAQMEKYTLQTKKAIYQRAVALMNAGRFDSISKLNAIKEEACIVDVTTNSIK